MSEAAKAYPPGEGALKPGRVPLSKLRFGHEYPDTDINARCAGRKDDIEQLAATILNEGLIQPLLICKSGKPKDEGTFFVIDGNRRLAALKHLVKTGNIEDAATYNVAMIESIGHRSPLDALRKSVIANASQLPMHPVDRYAAFAQCHDQGQTPAEIAARYAIDEQTVKRILALGRLSPTIRSAWRAGKIKANVAQAFTLAKAHKDQDAAYERLAKKSGLKYEHNAVDNVREEIVGHESETRTALLFVGRKDYEAAGGTCIEDLFSKEQGKGIPADRALLKKLANEKLKAKCDELVKNGWGWAATEDQLPNNHYSWDELPAGKNAKPEDKKKAGCIVEIDYDGKLDVQYGVIKPKSGKIKERAPEEQKKITAHDSAGEKPQAKKASITMAEIERLSVQLTKAAATAMIDDIDLMLAVLCATFASGEYGPCKISARGLGSDRRAPEKFGPAFERFRKSSRDHKLKALTHVVGAALDFTTRGSDHALKDKNIAAICAALNAGRLGGAIVGTFVAKDYFDSASKDLCLKAVEEGLGKEATKPLLDKKKSDIAKFAAKELPPKGWLPPELRTAHYPFQQLKAVKKGGKK